MAHAEPNEMLNDLCRVSAKAETKNAFHACRESHPLGRGNAWKWRNAYALACQDNGTRLAADCRTMDWLKAQARSEADAAL